MIIHEGKFSREIHENLVAQKFQTIEYNYMQSMCIAIQPDIISTYIFISEVTQTSMKHFSIIFILDGIHFSQLVP